ncbi:MAG: carbamoyltransferase [Proteobacteria bacterium]|nr:carbamoyltransferase [Pseudomonadota bacterium]
MTYILGISSFYHDSAAALIKGEKIIAAAQEERFTRKKHDPAFPKNAIKYCLEEAGIGFEEIEYVAFYDKPFLKFERLLETYLSEVPFGFKSFAMAIPVWLKEKLFLKDTLIKELLEVQKELDSEIDADDKVLIKQLKQTITDKILFAEHHQSHGGSAFFPSPFKDAAIITMDGVGEWTTTSIVHGQGNEMKFVKEIHFPHSLGLLYSAITYYCGFKVNSGEYKLMGLAPYGKPLYVDLIKKNLIDIKEDGSFKLNMKYFNYTVGLTMTNRKFHKLFGKGPRKAETEVTQFEMDVAASIQAITEEVVLKLAKTAREVTGSKNLCLAGGVALNCVANGKILRAGIFDNVWIQPASGDAGGALGAAQCAYYQHLGNARTTYKGGKDNMTGSYLGKKYSNDEVKKYFDEIGAKYTQVKDLEQLCDLVSGDLAKEKVVGWHQGRMEFGPRALGGRSIIGDPRSANMQKTMNLKIKYRESFRPFAPAVMREDLQKYFDIKDVDSPYMLIVAPVNDNIRKKISKEQEELFGIDKLNVSRSELPAITHVDYSARIQTIHEETNPRFYNLIKEFKKKTGCSVLINTSFNVRGEPVVCSPEDSYKCFMRTGMDVLVVEDFILHKEDQPNFDDKQDWQKEYELD